MGFRSVKRKKIKGPAKTPINQNRMCNLGRKKEAKFVKDVRWAIEKKNNEIKEGKRGRKGQKISLRAIKTLKIEIEIKKNWIIKWSQKASPKIEIAIIIAVETKTKTKIAIKIDIKSKIKINIIFEIATKINRKITEIARTKIIIGTNARIFLIHTYTTLIFFQ